MVLSFGCVVFDFVFQKREEFLSFVLENRGDADVREVRFGLRVAFAGAEAVGQFQVALQARVPPGERTEATLFVSAGPPYQLELQNPVFTDTSGQTKALGGISEYNHRGPDR